jgi:RimJ/RimL family protein N-acetyltransferase
MDPTISRSPELRTPRLLLRPWRDADLEPFAALNADPDVTAFLPGPLARAESDALAERIQAGIAERGWGFWAVEVPGAHPFIGFVGLSVPDPSLPFPPAVEIGWRLARAHWARGYATEAAREALRFGFEVLELAEIVAFTAVANRRSRAVMERIGMRDSGEGFDHPRLPEGHPLRRHVLYRMGRGERR